jgi:hypothetical protein
MYEITRVFAGAGITHVAHLLSGTRPGELLEITHYRRLPEATRRCITPTLYKSLLEAIPKAWNQVVQDASTAKSGNQTWDLVDTIQGMALPNKTWIRDKGGYVGQINIRKPYVLHATSGKAGREDGLKAALEKLDAACHEIDAVIHPTRCTILDDKTFQKLLLAAQKGNFHAGVFDTPCSTFFASRVGSDGTTFPAQVRSRQAPDGYKPGISDTERREVERSDKLVHRSIQLANAIVTKGGGVVFKNPSDRGGWDVKDPTVKALYSPVWADHAPLWCHPAMIDAKQRMKLQEVTFPQCAMGGALQSWTTIWYSQEFANTLDKLRESTCSHNNHVKTAHHRINATSLRSEELTSCPARVHEAIARAIHESPTSPRLQAMIEQWYQADTRGQLQPVPRMSTTLACVEAPRQVAVWKQVPNAHCKEEEEWRRRNSEDAPMPVSWLGGDIVDEVFLRSTTGQNTGGVNLGEWGWHYAVTDRVRPPMAVANADVHHIYFMMLSHIFCPPRTFDLNRAHTNDGREHTTYVDLLRTTGAGGEAETDMSGPLTISCATRRGWGVGGAK